MNKTEILLSAYPNTVFVDLPSSHTERIDLTGVPTKDFWEVAEEEVTDILGTTNVTFKHEDFR